MNVIWLGQAGLFIETGDLRILIDPYFSDSVGQRNPTKHRRCPVQDWMWDLEPDVLVFTHDHLDHYDPETAAHFLTGTRELTVLSPGTCWEKARAHGEKHNCVLFERGTQWTVGQTCFCAVTAVHSDPYAIGVVIRDEKNVVYVTGDTLYSEKIFAELPPHIDAVFLPINGVGNNMNRTDAQRFAHRCGAKLAVPIHWGMFDNLDPEIFAFEPKIIPQYAGTIKIGESV